MTDTKHMHPDNARLLAYLDGELEAAESDEVRRHTADCGPCTERARHLRAGLDAAVRLHHDSWKPAQPPPSPWPRLGPRLDELDRARPKHRPAARPWAWAAIAAALVAGVTLWRASTGDTVSAAELLEKAVAAEPAPSPARRIQVRTSRHQFTRPAVLAASSKADTVPTAAGPMSETEQLFRAANYDWGNPLSARSFSAWRTQLSERADEVQVLTNGETSGDRLYLIRTTTPHGALATASLTLRAADFHPVRERLDFRNREWVEITEAPSFEPAPRIEPSAPLVAGPLSRQDELFQPVGPAEELEVIAILHQLGADLGEPIDVRRDSDEGRIVVTGIGTSMVRRTQLRAALSGLPYVDLRFDEAQAARLAEQAGSAAAAAPPDPGTLHRSLEEQLGGRALVDQMINRVLDGAESALTRAHALRNLAVRFPPEVERTLPVAGRSTLERIWRRHAAALGEAARELEAALEPVLGTGQTAPAVSPCPGWQVCAAELLRSTQDLDEILTRTLAGAASPGGDASTRIGEVFAAWERQVAAYPAARESMANR